MPFALFGSLKSILTISAVVGILVLVGVVFWKMKHDAAEIASLNQTIGQLDMANTINKNTLDSVVKNQQIQADLTQRSIDQMSQIEQKTNDLKKLFAAKNLGKSAAAQPTDVQNQINAETAKTIKEIEDLSKKPFTPTPPMASKEKKK